MEKHMRKPFFDGGYAGSTPRMSVEDLQDGLAWVDDRFFPIRYEDEALPSVDWVLNVAKAAVLRSVCCYCNYLYDGPIPMLTSALPVPYLFLTPYASAAMRGSVWGPLACLGRLLALSSSVVGRQHRHGAAARPPPPACLPSPMPLSVPFPPQGRWFTSRSTFATPVQ